MADLAEIREALSAAPFDALIVTGEFNRRYVTRFHSSAGVCYISEKQAVFFTDFRYIEAARTTVREMDVRLVESGKNYSDVISELIRQDNVQKLALEDSSLTHAEFLKWEKSLNVQTVCMGDFFERLREIKDDDEVMHIVAAQRIAEYALDEILNDIRPGVSEKEIAARLTYLMLKSGAENMSFDPIVVSGVNSSRPHGAPTEKTIGTGEFVTMDFGCIVNGYCSDMTRTVCLGYPTDEMRLVYDTVLSAQLAGIAAVKAGVTGAFVDAAARKIIEEAGYGEAFGHGFGHGVGLFIHELPGASSGASKPLSAGSVMTAEPGIYLPGKFGVRIEDMLYIVEDGCINLTEAPKNLITL